jgi:hypothetical protein
VYDKVPTQWIFIYILIYCLHHISFSLGLFFEPEDGGNMFLRKVDSNSTECRFVIFFYLIYEAIGTAATLGLLCKPQMIVKMIVEKQMKCRLAGETEVLGEILHTFVHHKIPHVQTRV